MTQERVGIVNRDDAMTIGKRFINVRVKGLMRVSESYSSSKSLFENKEREPLDKE